MQDNSGFQNLKQKLESRHSQIKQSLVDKHWNAFSWASSNTKQIAAGALGSILLLTAPVSQSVSSNEKLVKEQFVDVPDNLFMVTDLNSYIPHDVGDLIPSQEVKIAEVLSKYYDIKITPEIDGFRLKNTYGYIGAEQHLMRYPGDTMSNHFTDKKDEEKYYSSGMAPGRGGFGYFAKSKSEITKEEIDEEKYYIAVQTFLAPGIEEKRREYINFFKFRKMIVVNPNTGRAVVAVIGDSGPAVWTGKQLGGSPEVMKHLERVDGKAKGAVLYFFIEDPENKIPLGPIDPIDQKEIAKIN